MAEKDLEMRRMNADATYTIYNPLTKATNVKMNDGTSVETKVMGHLADDANPHAVSKSQVGLGNVLNYGIATKAEAEEGTSNTKYMTPLRTKEEIEASIKVVSGVMFEDISASFPKVNIPIGVNVPRLLRLNGGVSYENYSSSATFANEFNLVIDRTSSKFILLIRTAGSNLSQEMEKIQGQLGADIKVSIYNSGGSVVRLDTITLTSNAIRLSFYRSSSAPTKFNLDYIAEVV